MHLSLHTEGFISGTNIIDSNVWIQSLFSKVLANRGGQREGGEKTRGGDRRKSVKRKERRGEERMGLMGEQMCCRYLPQ